MVCEIFFQKGPFPARTAVGVCFISLFNLFFLKSNQFNHQFEVINPFLFPLRSSEDLCCFDDFQGNRS